MKKHRKMKQTAIKLKRILDVQSVSGKQEKMKKTVKRILTAHNIKFECDHKGNILVTKGSAELYPMVCAHLDTVHSLVKGYTVNKAYNSNGESFYFAMGAKGIQTGVGGDDKVGIWAALNLIIETDVIKAGFFVDEEIGCIGSGALSPEFVADVSYIIQTDRKGNNDFIIGDYLQSAHKLFLSNVNTSKFGYEIREQYTITDCSTIGESNGILFVNLSSGYHRPHTSSEIVIIRESYNALNLMRHIIKSVPVHVQYTIESYKPNYTFWSDGKWDESETAFEDLSQDKYYTAQRCPDCGEQNAFLDSAYYDFLYCNSCESYVADGTGDTFPS